ncbi:uncharacterized protein LOC143315808 [Chaetodon auriga]|uniref:uncharacterized protein LOC143315808 n=1 Tax=Chaetodon auriga TaxID=39042 RepID=UPI004032D5BB
MACTTRSAVEYVKTARVHLVRELKNLSVIVENLYQQNVFSDEEVSKIKAERDDYDKSRAILDSVIKKGEAACYEFLRILDTTRKRSLDRRPRLPEKKSKASHEADKFDLHHWISCFSFTDEAQMDIDYLQAPRPCHRYQAKLKSKAQKISGAFWMANKHLFEENRKPNLSYASLVLDTQGSISTSKIKKLKSKKSKMIRSKKMRTYVPEDRPEISPSGLLKSDRDILVVGEPGIGKTALCHEMLKLWAETDSRELDYMFYFDMRETSHLTMVRSLEDLLFSVFSEPDEGKEEVLQDMKQNSDNVTIIFDNITDVSSSVVQKVVEKDLLPDAKLILTCRPDDDDEDFFGDFLRVEVKGFSEQTIKTYLSAVLGEEHEKVLSSVELLTLCHVPMYALMVAACLSSEAPEDSPQPCSITEVYISIVRFCLFMNSNKTKIQHLNSFITNKRQEILSLAEAAFHATERKSVILPGVTCADSCVLSFLKPLVISVACTEKRTLYAFLHYTMQEFFAALWLLKNPDKIQDVLQQCLTEEKKHMKHLIPFMCRLLTDKNPSLMKCLTPDQELKNTSEWLLKEMLSRFLRCQSHRGEDSGLDVDIVFLCQCLFESQCPEACVDFLNKLNHTVDLSGQSLESYPCCAVAYVVAQSNQRKVWLNLEDAVVSERGVRRLFGCLHNVYWYDPLPQQLWEVFLLSGGQVDGIRLLGLDRNWLHLPVDGKRQLFERAARFMQKNTTQVKVHLHWKNSTRVSQGLVEFLSEALPHISTLSFCFWSGFSGEAKLLVNLFCAAAEREQQTGEKILELLSSVCSYESFPLRDMDNYYDEEDYFYHSDFLLDLFSRLKEKEAEKGFSVLPSLQSVFQSAPAVWFIDLSDRKTSILLEVLRLQPEKKQVELTGCTGDQSEVRSLLQCLPYISQLSFWSRFGFSGLVELLVNLFCAAAEQQTGEKILELLSSVCSYESFPFRDTRVSEQHQSDVLLDLFSRLKEKEAEKGFSVLPSLQSVFQSAPAVWFINLSQRKTSILLEVLRLQPEKKRVELTDCTGDQSEVRSLLQCLPYISQLSSWSGFSGLAELLVNLFCAAAEQQTGEKILELLSSVCSYESFPFSDVDYDDEEDYFYHSDFLLDLFSRLKEKEAEKGFSVLPSLQSVFQSAPAVWFIDLSERKTSILLEVLRLQPEKKRVELTGCTGDQSEVRSLLQCLPYISQLRLSQKSFQQLLSLLHEIQDRDWTRSLLSALGGDLSRYRLSWEDLLYLLQQSPAQTLTVNLRNTHLFQESVPHVFPFLDRIVFKRPCPSFVFAAITEIYRARAGSIIPSLLRSLDHEINLTCRKMDSVSCAALLFTLKHSDRVKLKLLWTSIPTEEVESILFTLDNVSQLSVDRNLLLRFIHCCAAPDGLQGAAAGLLRTVQHRLDLSCSSCVELPEEEQSETLRLTFDDCRAVSTILRHSSRDTQLHLHDCEVEDGGLDLLFPALDRVRLRASTAVLLQLVSLVPGSSERDSVRRAASLCRTLGGELDFSHTTLDQRTCAALSLMLDVSEGLTELDLSHCELTDQLLSTLITHLHKVQVLDLSHNRITDASSRLLLQLVSIHPSMDSVRLFGNKIVDKTPFKTYEQFEIW